ncbi:hypothetical protein [Sinosporangium album]|uniref:hypothetical protein n=1 Tax=Sinosporangium album TaxID=504805 RepID=UPI00115FE7C2|nr:hypothetical protein [Sinosporangium album]
MISALPSVIICRSFDSASLFLLFSSLRMGNAQSVMVGSLEGEVESRCQGLLAGENLERLNLSTEGSMPVMTPGVQIHLRENRLQSHVSQRDVQGQG